MYVTHKEYEDQGNFLSNPYTNIFRTIHRTKPNTKKENQHKL